MNVPSLLTLEPTDLVGLAADAWRLLAPAAIVATLRMADVTLNVFRTVFTVQGRKLLAALFHAVEGTVWLLAAGIVLADLSPVRIAGFVVGIMAGTVLGMWVVEALKLGMVTVRIYVDADNPNHSPDDVMRAIHEAGYGATSFAGTGYRGPVTMILSTVPRRRVAAVMAIVAAADESTVATVDNDWVPRPVAVRS